MEKQVEVLKKAVENGQGLTLDATAAKALMEEIETLQRIIDVQSTNLYESVMKRLT
jgi:ribosomal protein S12 methylthiotransferase accessory factor YcaO